MLKTNKAQRLWSHMLRHRPASSAASNALKHVLRAELLLETAVFHLMFLAQKPSSADGSRGHEKHSAASDARRSPPVSCFAAFQARSRQKHNTAEQ